MSAFITYKNTPIHYTESGKGTAIVLLHGFLENTTMWESLEKVLNSKFRVVCIDLLGHGQTESLGYVHTMTEMAEAVKAVLDALNIRRSFFVGHSMGGYVALAFADLYPDNVKGLVLLNSTARPDSEEKKIGRDRAIAVVKENHKSFIRTSIPMLFRSKCRKIYADEIAKVKKEALKTSRQGIIAALEGMKIRLDREVLLHFGPYPSLMILGKKDPVLNYEDLIAQTKDANTEVVELENGHMSLIEDREGAEQAILEFVKRN
ncbi:alpha/beta fold hydrolase [Wenyingzhuangia marina]|uniref:Pimeloyl-ACP methyl ester carboxylesterase n=1 Tax=Wenyingzhuangia marina TaxID=1195760 RepID=A0A1M5SRK2_9FLAO|nr:alpha/beta hydrolase [Wenyingzhuangia marina]GGF63627.1 alpha/beta hydrolase [Wenyingzhuangia marina]SHH41126.1 Pimeloyl-ACP methyl ester carboxylesterase [Wenyingzhuangia marina]